MKKIIILFLALLSFNICFANTDAYTKTLSSRKTYISQGISDISSYSKENISTNQKQLIQNSANTAIFDINEIISKANSLISKGKTFNMKIVQNNIEKKVNIFSETVKKYYKGNDTDTLISDFKKGIQNIYQTNFQTESSESNMNFSKESKNYNQIYQKLKIILQKYPGEKYKDFLNKLSNEIDQKKSKILKRKTSDKKKSKYITMYETLELVIKDFENGK